MAAGFEISFIDTETARWLEDAPDDGLCLKKFRADFNVDNLRSFEEGEVEKILDSLHIADGMKLKQ